MKNFNIFVWILLLIIRLFSAHAKRGNDWQSQKFLTCCKNANIPCAEDACFYPPPAMASFDTELCEGKHINEFIKCYADGQDNTQCCDDAGVTGIYGICQDFCNGVDPDTWANPLYAVCKLEVDAISECNRDVVKPSKK